MTITLVFAFEHVKPKRRSLSIDQCLTAFNVFVIVYTIKAPSAISSLMKYCEVVWDIAAKQGNWSSLGFFASLSLIDICGIM